MIDIKTNEFNEFIIPFSYIILFRLSLLSTKLAIQLIIELEPYISKENSDYFHISLYKRYYNIYPK